MELLVQKIMSNSPDLRVKKPHQLQEIPEQRYLLWKEQNGRKHFHEEDGLLQFSRRALTRKLSQVLNSVLGLFKLRIQFGVFCNW